MYIYINTNVFIFVFVYIHICIFCMYIYIFVFAYIYIYVTPYLLRKTPNFSEDPFGVIKQKNQSPSLQVRKGFMGKPSPLGGY